MTNFWVINVSGYGSFLHSGDEASAEEMRVHKASTPTPRQSAPISGNGLYAQP